MNSWPASFVPLISPGGTKGENATLIGTMFFSKLWGAEREQAGGSSPGSSTPTAKQSVQPLHDSHDVGFVHCCDVAPVVVPSILEGKLCNALARLFCDKLDALHDTINNLKERKRCFTGWAVASLWYRQFQSTDHIIVAGCAVNVISSPTGQASQALLDSDNMMEPWSGSHKSIPQTRSGSFSHLFE